MNRIKWFFVVVIALVTAIAVHDMTAQVEPVATKIDTSQATDSADIGSVAAEFASADQQINAGDMISNAVESVVSPEVVEMWVAATNSADQAERDAANDSLVKAPKEKTLPVLQKIITSGNASDRQSAINVLRMIALKQSDADGEIQNLLRLTIYDGDDALVGEAQLALEDIERGSAGERMLLVNP